MGFWDTMKGVGRSLGGFLETTLQTVGPAIAQAGAQRLISEIAPSRGGGGGGYAAPAYAWAPQRPIPSVPAARIPTGMPRSAVPPSWSPLPSGGYPSPAVYQPSPAYGYRPAGTAEDLLRFGAEYLFGNGGQHMPSFEGYPGTSGEGLMAEGMERLRALTRGTTTFYRYGGTRVSPVREIQVAHPETGAILTWKYMGRPILYSGDLAACKRVSKVARRAARRRPR